MQSSTRDGKLYMHSEDMCKRGMEMNVGMLMQFHVYTDGQGLGAEEISFF